jgi:DNA-directed RNA polymerase subunit beta
LLRPSFRVTLSDMPVVINSGEFKEVPDDEVDYELVSPSNQFSTHVNLIPVQSAVQVPRHFYGARFANQAMPVKNPESPLVQNLDTSDGQGLSFDQKLGRNAGAVFSDHDGVVERVAPDSMHVVTPEGERVKYDLYNNHSFNRKSAIHSLPLVKAGDKISKNQILSKSNFTNDEGELAMGLNARIGAVPYRGYSLDDAIVLSASFANKLQSEHTDTHILEHDRDTKTGLGHFKSLFPEKFKKAQLSLLDENGVVRPGTILQQGDPIILSTRPRVISSAGTAGGKMTKSMSQARSDASQVWDSDYPAEVVDVFHNKKNIKVVTKSYAPTRNGDKIVMRSGAKAIVSKILEDERMPHTEDGQPLDVLLNPLSLYSRSNLSLPYEMLLGKVAAKTGKRQRISGFTQVGQKWRDIIEPLLKENQMEAKERVFDPGENRFLDNPVLVGNAYIMKLHHLSSSKISSRGQGSYDQWQQPTKGAGAGGKSKRLSGLESAVMLSAGAYANLREGSTLRGQQNDDYWRSIRTGQIPKKPGVPFAWEKAMNMLRGAGIDPREVEPGKLRLGPMRDSNLAKLKPVEIKSGELLNLSNMSPVEGGLFDKAIVGNNGWGQISIPYKVPNPAYEEAVRTLLGLKKKDLEDILRGRMELPEHLR